jgi:hypothetical protein
MKKDHLTLTENDRTTLEGLLAKGTLAVKTFKRATALLELDRGKTLRAVAETLDVTYTTVAAWRNGYRTKGLDCLYDAPRSGRPIVIDGAQRAKVTALACSDAPEGHDRWSTPSRITVSSVGTTNLLPLQQCWRGRRGERKASGYDQVVAVNSGRTVSYLLA